MSDAILSFDEFCDQDISSNKHGGSLESKDAFNAMKHGIGAMRQDVLDTYEKFGELTAREAAEILCKPLHAVSGRCSELKALCFLEKTGERRNGGAVLRRTGKELQ